MANTSFIPTAPPLWQTQLAFDLNPSDTSATLAPELLISGIPLPAGSLVCVSIDIGQPNPEYIIGTLTANVLTFITRNVDPLDPTVSIGAFTSTHGQGAIVKITDYATIQSMRNILQGLIALQNPLISIAPAVNPTDVPNYSQLTSAVIAGGVPATDLILGLVRLAKLLPITLGTCTITIASPAVITLANHGLTVNDIVSFSTTGALPTGITPGSQYYVLSTGLTTNTFEISLTPGGTPINTSGSQSGTQTLTKNTPVVLSGTPNTNDALNGTSGTPSLQNKFETENDTTSVASYKATTISFSAPSSILDSANGFITAGFRVGDSIAITGSASNNATFTIITLAVGAINVLETTVVNEVAGATDTIKSVIANKLSRLNSVGQILAPLPYALDTGSANTYAISIPNLNVLPTGQSVSFKVLNTNTGASTLAINGGSAIAIKKNISSALAGGELVAGAIVTVNYDGTNFQITTPNALVGNKIYVSLAGYSAPTNTTEDTAFTFTVPGGTMGTNNALNILFTNANMVQATTYTWTIRFKYGGTTFATLVLNGNNSATVNGNIFAIFAGSGATNSQGGTATVAMFSASLGTSNIGSAGGSSAIDSTVDQTFTITAQLSSTSGSGSSLGILVVEKIS